VATKLLCTVKAGSDVQLLMRELCGRDDVSMVVRITEDDKEPEATKE
jgi:hypothetical protein